MVAFKVIPVPTVTMSLVGSRVIEPVPTVNIPVTLASPSTTNYVGAHVTPVPTSNLLLAVTIPIESTFFTSS